MVQKTLLSTNTNGSSPEKIEQIKAAANERRAWAFLIQEFKSKSISKELLAAFPIKKWQYLFSPFDTNVRSQGLLSLVKKDKAITVSMTDCSISGLLMHSIKVKTARQSFAFGNIYVKPDLELSRPNAKAKFYEFLDGHSFVIGDYNYESEPARKQILENYLLEKNKCQLINFPTYKKPGQSERAKNLTDFFVSDPTWEHKICDTNHFIVGYQKRMGGSRLQARLRGP